MPKSFAVALVSSCLLLTSCGPSYPTYPGSPVVVDNMVPFQDDDVAMMLTPGWEKKPINDATNEALRGLFVKSGEVLTVMCFKSAFLQRDGLHDAALAVVRGVMPDARRVEGPYELEASGVAPIMEVYDGHMIIEGEEHPMTMVLASKWTRGFGCKYAVNLQAMRDRREEAKRELVAIAQSLQ